VGGRKRGELREEGRPDLWKGRGRTKPFGEGKGELEPKEGREETSFPSPAIQHAIAFRIQELGAPPKSKGVLAPNYYKKTGPRKNAPER